MFDFVEKSIKLRRDLRALREGKTIDLFYDSDSYVFERKFESESVIIAINNSDMAKK